MTHLGAMRSILTGATGRLALVLGLATGLAFASAAMAPKAHAESLSFGFSFGDPGYESVELRHPRRNRVIEDRFDDRSGIRIPRSRYREPLDFFEPGRLRHRRAVKTICRIVPVRVWNGDYYEIQDVQRCRKVRRS